MSITPWGSGAASQFAMAAPFPYGRCSLATARRPSARGVPRRGPHWPFRARGIRQAYTRFGFQTVHWTVCCPWHQPQPRFICRWQRSQLRLPEASNRRQRQRGGGGKPCAARLSLQERCTHAAGTGCSCNPRKSTARYFFGKSTSALRGGLKCPLRIARRRIGNGWVPICPPTYARPNHRAHDSGKSLRLPA